MPNIAVTLPIEPDWRGIVEEVLAEAADLEFLVDLSDDGRLASLRRADALLAWNPHAELSADELAAADSAEFMQLMSAGADHLDFDDLPDGLTVASNAGAYAEPIAEHVLGMTISLARHLRREHENLRRGEFNQRRVNKSVRGANLGIVGYGGIGREVARVFRPLGVDVYAVNTTGRTDDEVAWCGTLEELDYLLARADVLVLSLPLTPRTAGLIGAEELRAMKSDAILINVARGEHVDQEALYEHLTANEEFQAGLEAWWVEPFRHGEFRVDYPLLELPNVLGCPHNSAVVPGALRRGIRRASQNLKRRLQGAEVDGLVDPEVYR